MGAWGVQAFDNDDACDWSYGLDEVGDFSLVESAFDAVEKSQGCVEAPDGCNALAACEVIARALGRPGYQNSLTENVDNWVKKQGLRPAPKLIARAEAIIQRVLAEESELRALWCDGDGGPEWLEAVQDLRTRLRG